VNPQPHRDLVLINAAGFLRSLGVGLMGVVLGIYLFRVGLSSLTIGLVIATGLVGSVLATIIVSFAADRLGRRQSLLVLSLLTGIGGLALALSPTLTVLLAMAFIGMPLSACATSSPTASEAASSFTAMNEQRPFTGIGRSSSIR
jgi:MFS family permease